MNDIKIHGCIRKEAFICMTIVQIHIFSGHLTSLNIFKHLHTLNNRDIFQEIGNFSL